VFAIVAAPSRYSTGGHSTSADAGAPGAAGAAARLVDEPENSDFARLVNEPSADGAGAAACGAAADDAATDDGAADDGAADAAGADDAAPDDGAAVGAADDAAADDGAVDDGEPPVSLPNDEQPASASAARTLPDSAAAPRPPREPGPRCRAASRHMVTSAMPNLHPETTPL